MSSFLESTSSGLDRVYIDIPEGPEKDVEGKAIGLWNGRVVEELTRVLQDFESLTREGVGPLMLSSEASSSDIFSCAGAVAVTAGCICLLVINVIMISSLKRTSASPIDFLVPNIFWGSCMLSGIGCFGAAWCKGRRIKQRLEIRNGEVDDQIERIQKGINFFEGLSPDLPADTGPLVKLLDIFTELEFFSRNWRRVIPDDLPSDELSKSLVKDRNSIYSKLSYKQLLDLLRIPDIDEDTKEWLKELHVEKADIVQALCSSSSSSLSSSKVATFIRLYGKDVFIDEPEVLREYLHQLPKEITASSEVKNAVEYIESQIGLITDLSSVPGAVAALLSANSDFVVVVKGERINVPKKELLLCDIFEARVRLEESSSMWSNTIKMEAELPEMSIELPEEIELEIFKQMLQCLHTGRIAEDDPNLEALLNCADYFGATPIIEAGQLVLLCELGKNADRLRSTELKEALGKILSKSSSSRQVQNVASKVFKKVVFSAAKNKSWERIRSLLEFAKEYSAFNMCLHSIKFGLSETELLPVHVELAFNFNLVEFQKQIKEVFACKIKTESKISLILEQYQVSEDAKFVLQGIVRQYIRKDVFRDVWEYAEKTEDLDLKKICLDYAEEHPHEVISLWGPLEIPEQIAAYLAGQTLLI